MSLPLSLRRAIEGGSILPIIGAGTPDFISRNPRRFDTSGESFVPLYEAAAAVANDCIVALTAHPHLHGILSACDASWGGEAADSDMSMDAERKLLIELASRTDSWVTGPSDNPKSWERARSHAARAPLLLLGCDPRDDGFFEAIPELRPNGFFQPVGWLVTSDTSDDIRERWSSIGFEVVAGPIRELISALREVGAARPHIRKDTGRPIPEPVIHPYKHLDSFGRKDWRIYFGRERETRRLVELVCAHRLIVVSGPSGTGKTSLLQAGLLAWTDRHPPCVGIYARCGENPEASLTDALNAELQLPREAARGSVIQALERFTASRRGFPIVVIDQTEELFTRFNDALRDRFLAVLRECLGRPALHVRFVLAIRDDFLARLADVRSVVPTILQNSFYVPLMSRRAALDAIRKPAAVADVHMGEAVATRILEDIGTERIRPPELQIVCDSLFRQREGNEISVALYEKLGTARALLTNFMEHQIEALGCDGALAREVLKAMVTAEGTKDVLTVREIARRARQQVGEVERVLTEIEKRRLICIVPGDADVRFELIHEYLTTTIWAWLSEEERERREVEELLLKEIRAWRQFRTIRLGADRLKRFERSVHLLDLDADRITLFLLSSVTQHQSSEVWVGQLGILDREAQNKVALTLFTYFSDQDRNQRCEAAEVIAVLDPALLVQSLDSPVAGHRHAALEMLGGLRQAAAVARITVCLTDTDETCRVLACGALGSIGGPEATAALVQAIDHSDGATARAAIEALGRTGFPESCLDFIVTSLVGQWGDLASLIHSALACGKSPAVLERLLKAPGDIPVTRVWSILEGLPISSRKWLENVLSDLSPAQLDAADYISIDCWVGHDVQMKKYHRKLKSQFTPWSKDTVIEKLRECAPSNLGALVAGLGGLDRKSVVAELATRSGAAGNAVLTTLIKHRDARARRAALEIAMARRSMPDSSLARHLVETALADSDASVRAFACQLAMTAELWSLLERRIRPEVESDGKVRAGALRGLVPSECFIPIHLLERALDSSEPLECYWACLVARRQKLTNLLAMIRRLVWNTTAIAKTGYEYHPTWPGHDPEVGHCVADAAHAALATLAPASEIWRNNVSWQRKFNAT